MMFSSFKERISIDHEGRSHNIYRSDLFEKSGKISHVDIRENAVVCYYGCLGSPRPWPHSQSCAGFPPGAYCPHMKQITPALSALLSPSCRVFSFCFSLPLLFLNSGAVVKARDKYRHPECFVCADCNLNLKQKGYFFVEGELYCETHARARTRPPEGYDTVTLYPKA